ncbi:hypothetical protein [Streptomyces sp. ML-6]|uniref:hypothetical protein n=1 Tax=Streptomyces sp. ML-6 TaxID=2982693 RepID=UPI0024BF4988|nr:hypothetical protein [Streptomyces sp. ML-6]MDK0519524.1 hypothetical protein [Streptomyces sp. ML-6]
MLTFSALLQDATSLAAISATAYTGLLATVALASVLAPTPEHRRDARATLTILMRRRPPR